MKSKYIGVKFIDKKHTYIGKGVKFGRGVVVYPNNYIYGNCEIGNGVVLMPNNYILNSKIGNNCKISFSFLEECEIKNGVTIGPFARIRQNTIVGNGCKIGNFVEIKNSCLGDGTKAGHLAYVGDANVGENCNIGCGAIFVNYNGKTKNKTVVEDNCFIGSNVNLIAPLNIKKCSYITAGATVVQDTNEYDFVIGRVKPTIKSGRAKNYLKQKN